MKNTAFGAVKYNSRHQLIMPIQYIDPVLRKALHEVSPQIKKEVNHTMDIALRIHEILVRKNWSQADLARATNKKEAIVSSWLSGTHNFTVRTIAEIEAALEEDIITVKRYRKPSEIVSGYRVSSKKAAFLNEAKVKSGK